MQLRTPRILNKSHNIETTLPLVYETFVANEYILRGISRFLWPFVGWKKCINKRRDSYLLLKIWWIHRNRNLWSSSLQSGPFLAAQVSDESERVLSHLVFIKSDGEENQPFATHDKQDVTHAILVIATRINPGSVVTRWIWMCSELVQPAVQRETRK